MNKSNIDINDPTLKLEAPTLGLMHQHEALTLAMMHQHEAQWFNL